MNRATTELTQSMADLNQTFRISNQKYCLEALPQISRRLSCLDRIPLSPSTHAVVACQLSDATGNV